MIHQSLTKDLRCALYQLLFSHLLEGLLDIPVRHSDVIKRAFLKSKSIFRCFYFPSVFFTANFCCTISKRWRMQIMAPLSRGVPVLPCCCRTKNSFRSEEKGEKKILICGEKRWQFDEG